jgi:homoserine dehydrogenase
VVTANKALLAKHLPEITALLKEHPEVKFAYEAAVCGGIPIIHTLQNDYLGDQVSQVGGCGGLVYQSGIDRSIDIGLPSRASHFPPPQNQILGIMNGTTNFMLTKMEGGADYGEVLAEAQALGFAEGAQC